MYAFSDWIDINIFKNEIEFEMEMRNENEMKIIVKWKVKNEKWKMKNEKWKMKNEKWKMKTVCWLRKWILLQNLLVKLMAVYFRNPLGKFHNIHLMWVR